MSREPGAPDDPPGADDLTRRTLLRTGVAAGTATLIGLSGAAGGVPVSNDDFETTTGVTEPEYEQGEPEEHYVATEYTLPEATGGETESPTLFGEVIWPVDPDTGEAVTDVPVILTYSPYNDIVSPQSEVASIAADGIADYFVPRGYARAVFDLVGCRNSGGCYDYGGYRERVTGKQLVEYLGGEPDAAGEYVVGEDGEDGEGGTRTVGMIGASYNGTTALAAAIEDPDHLEAIVPQVAIDRWYDYAFGGGIRYFLNNEYPTDEGFDTPLAFDLGFGFVPGLNVDDGEQFVATNERRFAPCDGVEHTERAYEYDPVYDAFWDRRDYRQRAGGYQPEAGTDAAAEQNGDAPVRGVNCAVFLETGWLDHNVKHWNTTRFFDALPANVPKKLVIGQWSHTSTQFEDARDLRHAWFDEFLKGLDTGVRRLPPVDTQVNTGERLQHRDMPPTGTQVQRFELTRGDAAEDRLALRGPAPSPTFVDAKPPATEAEMFSTDGSTHSHLEFESAPLSGPLRITGSLPLGDWRAPLLDVLASSTGGSVHFTPVLYDRHPDGSREVITRGFLNARKRGGLDTDEPVPTDVPYRAPTELWDTDYVLQEGHRLGITVSADNREWCLDDPDGSSITEVILGAPGSDDGTGLYLPVADAPASLQTPSVAGQREDDADAFTAGEAERISLSVEADERVAVRDVVPEGWTVLGVSDDVDEVVARDDGTSLVYFAPEGEAVDATYFVEAPAGADQTGTYTFGPVEARGRRGGWVAVAGTEDTNVVVGVDT